MDGNNNQNPPPPIVPSELIQPVVGPLPISAQPPVTQIINPQTLFTSDQNASPLQPISKKRGKFWLLLFIVVLVAVLIGAYLFVSTKPTVKKPATKTSESSHLSLPNQPKQQNAQYSSQYFASGYVQYNPTKLQTVNIVVPKIEPILPQSPDFKDKEVIFMADLSAVNTKRLIMYDVASSISYLVDEDKSVGNYYHPHIMSNHYVVFAVLSQSDPVTSTTAIKVFDLNTGITQTIIAGKSSEIPIALCCAVSPDGLRMAIPETNRLLIYQAGEDSPTSFNNIKVKIFPDTKGATSNDDYAASQRNGGYPGLVWLDDNRIMYGKSNTYSWTVDSSGSHIATNNNGLAIYDLSNNTSKDVARTSTSAIKQFFVDGNSIIFTVVNKDLNGLTVLKIDDYTKTDYQPLEQTSSDDYQSKVFYDQGAKKLYIQPSGAGSGQETTIMQVLDTTMATSEKVKIGTFPYPSLEGVIGPDQLIVNNSYSVNNDYNIYNSKTKAVEHIFSFSH